MTVKKGDGSTVTVSGLDMLDKLITTATPHHGSPGSVFWWLKKNGYTSQLADFAKDLFSPGGQDLFWDNYDGIFDWAVGSSFNYSESGADVNRIDVDNSGRRSENAAFDGYFRIKLHLLDSKANDIYTGKLSINSQLATVYRYPNPWLSWMNVRFKQNKSAYVSKYVFYGGYNDGNIIGPDNRLNDAYISDLAADARIYEMGYINDWAVPLTSGFLDFSKENSGALYSYNTNLFSDSGGKSALFPTWLTNHTRVELNSSVNSIPTRALKDYNHDRLVNGAYYSTPADLQAHVLPSGFNSDTDAQIYMEQSGVSFTNYQTAKSDPVLQADAKLLFEPLFNLFKKDLTASMGSVVIVTPQVGVGGTISPAMPQSVSKGDFVTFNLIPDSGYTIDNVTGCGGTLNSSAYEIFSASADCTVTVTFKQTCQQTIGNLFFKSSTCKTFTSYNEFYGDITVANSSTPSNPVLKIFDGSLTLDSVFNKVSMPLVNGIKPVNILGVNGIGNVPILGAAAFSFEVEGDTLKVPTGNSEIAVEGIQKLSDLLFGFHFSLVSIKIGSDSAKISGKVVTGSIEDTLFTDGREPVSLTGTVMFSQSTGLGLDAIALNASNLSLLSGAVNIKDAGVSYSHSEEKFSIQGMVNIPHLMDDAGLGGGVTFVRRRFDGFSVAASGLNYPLGTSGIFFNAIKLKVENLDLRPAKIELKGSFSGGPEMLGNFKAICFNDVGGSIDFKGIFMMEGGAGIFCLDSWESIKNGVMTGRLSATYDHTKNTFTASGDLTYPLNLIKTNATLYISSTDFYGKGKGAICPPIAGCFAEADQILNKNGIGSSTRFKDKEVAVFVDWHVFDALSFPLGIPIIDPVVASKHIKIGDNLDELVKLVKTAGKRTAKSAALAAENIVTIPAGLEFAIVRVKWQEGTAEVTLTAPDGTVINPNYASANPDTVAYMALGNEAWYALEPPAAGVWQVNVADAALVGGYEVSLNTLNAKPTIAVTSPASTITSSSTATISYTAADPDSTPTIALYYDTKNSGGAGIKIAENLPMPIGTGSFIWDVSAVPPGVYYVYAFINDGVNMPVISYSPGTVEVVSSAALATPANFSAAASADGIVFTWAEVANATGYNIYLTDDLSSEAYSVPVALTTGTASYTAAGLKPGSTYRATISAFNASGLESQRAASKTVITNNLPVPIISVSSSSLDFGSVNNGATGSKSITITNNGAVDLVLSSSLFSGSNSSQLSFNPALTLPLTLAAGQSVTADITLNAVSSGAINTILFLVSNDPVTPKKSVAMTASIPYQNYTVTFAAGNNGSISGATSQTVTSSGSTTEVTAVPDVGYHFVNWTGTNGFVTTATNALTVNNMMSSQAITANFAINSYTVSFNSNGGSVVTSQTITYNTTASVPTAPTKTGNTFAGWYSDAALTTVFAFNTPISVDSTLYTKWTIIPPTTYTVTPTAGTGFSIFPATAQIIGSSATTSFTITPDVGYGLLSVGGCNGSLNGTTYTTSAIIGDCSISVTTIKRTGNSGSGAEPILADALKALQAYSGVLTLTAAEKIRYDVAPLGNTGLPVGNGSVDAADVILILRRSVGIGGW